MITNDLCVSSDPSNMIDNDLYEGSGDMRTAPDADSTYEVVGGARVKGAAATPKLGMKAVHFSSVQFKS